jgi:hypothetical protein
MLLLPRLRRFCTVPLAREIITENIFKERYPFRDEITVHAFGGNGGKGCKAFV